MIYLTVDLGRRPAAVTENCKVIVEQMSIMGATDE